MSFMYFNYPTEVGFSEMHRNMIDRDQTYLVVIWSPPEIWSLGSFTSLML